MIVSLNQRKTKFEPGMKVNCNFHQMIILGVPSHTSHLRTRPECGIRVPLQVINYLLDSSSCRKVY